MLTIIITIIVVVIGILIVIIIIISIIIIIITSLMCMSSKLVLSLCALWHLMWQLDAWTNEHS